MSAAVRAEESRSTAPPSPFFLWIYIIISKNILQVSYAYYYNTFFNNYKSIYYQLSTAGPYYPAFAELFAAFLAEIVIPTLVKWDLFFAFSLVALSMLQHKGESAVFSRAYIYTSFLVWASLSAVDISLAWVFWSLCR